MEAFGRRWHIGSDDLPLPMISLMTVHTVWRVPGARSPLRRRSGAEALRSAPPAPRRCLIVFCAYVGARLGGVAQR